MPRWRCTASSGIADLGATVDEYRARFQLRYRNNHRLEADDYPIERVVAGEAFSEVVVEVTVAGEDEPRWVHQVRSLVLNDADDDEPACLVLIIQDVSARFEAEDRFEQSFNANPAPGGDLPPERPALRQGQPGFPRHDRARAAIRCCAGPSTTSTCCAAPSSAISPRSGSPRGGPSRRWRPNWSCPTAAPSW